MSNRSHTTVAGRAHLGVVLATAAALPLSAVCSQPSATAAEAGTFVAVPVDQAAIQMEAALRGSSALGGNRIRYTDGGGDEKADIYMDTDVGEWSMDYFGVINGYVRFHQSAGAPVIDQVAAGMDMNNPWPALAGRLTNRKAVLTDRPAPRHFEDDMPPLGTPVDLSIATDFDYWRDEIPDGGVDAHRMDMGSTTTWRLGSSLYGTTDFVFVDGLLTRVKSRSDNQANIVVTARGDAAEPVAAPGPGVAFAKAKKQGGELRRLAVRADRRARMFAGWQTLSSQSGVVPHRWSVSARMPKRLRASDGIRTIRLVPYYEYLPGRR